MGWEYGAVKPTPARPPDFYRAYGYRVTGCWNHRTLAECPPEPGGGMVIMKGWYREWKPGGYERVPSHATGPFPVQSSWRAAINRECPHCGEQPGHHCRRPSGQLASSLHTARRVPHG